MGFNSPGSPGNQLPAGEDHIVRRLRDIERTITEMKAQDQLLVALTRANLRMDPGALKVLGALDVAGSVSLPAGSINNDALADPNTPQAVYQSATGFAPGPAWSEVVGVDLIVPATATRLLLTANAWVYAINSTASPDDLHARVSVGTVNGQAFLTPLPAAGYNTSTSGLAALVESLTPGATLHLSVGTKTTTGTFAANAAHTATLSARLTWLR
ncbi:MAG: hypothetical protein ABI903_16505 [Actinomycetota bacterium]